MKKNINKKTLLHVVTAALGASFLVTALASHAPTPNNDTAIKSIESEYQKAQSSATLPLSQDSIDTLVNQGVNRDALMMALKAYVRADQQGVLHNKRYLTLVDFSKPSTEPRMHVIDLSTNKIVFNELVTQGSGSGTGKWATYFSDVGNSHASELGAIVTENTYFGKHGYSLRLAGLESINRNIENRAVVVHSANYATPSFVDNYGRLGNSWGCFAMDPSVSSEVISVIKGGSLLYAYSPQLKNIEHFA